MARCPQAQHTRPAPRTLVHEAPGLLDELLPGHASPAPRVTAASRPCQPRPPRHRGRRAACWRAAARRGAAMAPRPPRGWAGSAGGGEGAAAAAPGGGDTEETTTHVYTRIIRDAYKRERESLHLSSHTGLMQVQPAS